MLVKGGFVEVTKSAMEYKKTLDWIKDVRKGCKDILEKDAKKILKIVKKGRFETEEFYDLLMEIRDNERDEALLSLFEEMIKEDENNG